MKKILPQIAIDFITSEDQSPAPPPLLEAKDEPAEEEIGTNSGIISEIPPSSSTTGELPMPLSDGQDNNDLEKTDPEKSDQQKTDQQTIVRQKTGLEKTDQEKLAETGMNIFHAAGVTVRLKSLKKEAPAPLPEKAETIDSIPIPEPPATHESMESLESMEIHETPEIAPIHESEETPAIPETPETISATPETIPAIPETISAIPKKTEDIETVEMVVPAAGTPEIEPPTIEPPTIPPPNIEAQAAPTPEPLETKPPKPAPPVKSTRGRKSLKQTSAEADLIEIPGDEVLFSKQYYTMGEVAEMFRVNQSLLRFWEAEFDVLKPRKNKKGDRYFRPVDIKNLHLIYHLLRQRKYTIEGAKDFLKKNKKAEERFEAIQNLHQIKAFLLEWKAQL
jgi:DNA-binding transcriptional MerR regulator